MAARSSKDSAKDQNENYHVHGIITRKTLDVHVRNAVADLIDGSVRFTTLGPVSSNILPDRDRTTLIPIQSGPQPRHRNLTSTSTPLAQRTHRHIPAAEASSSRARSRSGTASTSSHQPRPLAASRPSLGQQYERDVSEFGYTPYEADVDEMEDGRGETLDEMKRKAEKYSRMIAEREARQVQDEQAELRGQGVGTRKRRHPESGPTGSTKEKKSRVDPKESSESDEPIEVGRDGPTTRSRSTGTSIRYRYDGAGGSDLDLEEEEEEDMNDGVFGEDFTIGTEDDMGRGSTRGGAGSDDESVLTTTHMDERADGDKKGRDGSGVEGETDGQGKANLGQKALLVQKIMKHPDVRRMYGPDRCRNCIDATKTAKECWWPGKGRCSGCTRSGMRCQFVTMELDSDGNGQRAGVEKGNEPGMKEVGRVAGKISSSLATFKMLLKAWEEPADSFVRKSFDGLAEQMEGQVEELEQLVKPDEK